MFCPIQLRMMLRLRVPMQAEEGFEMFARDALARVVHAPVAAARRDAYPVDPNDQIRSRVRSLKE